MPSDQLPPDNQEQAVDDSCTPTSNKVVQLNTPDASHRKPRDTQACSSELPAKDNVVNLFTGASVEDEQSARIVRIFGETNGARMLYATLDQPERLVAVPILCWALLEDGTVSGMVPWLDEVL
ncbi:MAG: hypothetical protein HKO84_01180, partial [Pseudomonadales bacterium]|nr:hypothetical protein [Pseudomonadales bacterium]